MRNVIAHTKQPWWLNLTGSILGFEGEGEGGDGNGGDGSGEGEGNAGEGAGEGQGSQGTGTEGDGAADDAAGLKSALQKERAEKRAMEKELKQLRKDQQTRTDAEKTEIQRATDAEKQTAAKVEKLAAGFRNNALETAILKAAGAAKFRDPSDALRPEVIAAIGVEQDEDDPTKVEVDADSVTAAIKALAKSKPHYIITAEAGKPKSGSSFGGSANGGQGDAAKAELIRKYPALRGL